MPVIGAFAAIPAVRRALDGGRGGGGGGAHCQWCSGWGRWRPWEYGGQLAVLGVRRARQGATGEEQEERLGSGMCACVTAGRSREGVGSARLSCTCCTLCPAAHDLRRTECRNLRVRSLSRFQTHPQHTPCSAQSPTRVPLLRLLLLASLPYSTQPTPLSALLLPSSFPPPTSRSDGT